MKCKFLSVLMLFLALSANAQFILPTPWSEKSMRAEVPLSEYPRPQMQRHDWLCLNGQWEYCGGAIAPKALDAPGYRKAPGDCGNGDFIDIHTYGKIAPREMPKATATRAASLGEFGGKGLFVRGHMWPVRNDAYEMMTSSEQLTDTYIYLLTEVEQMKLYSGLSAAVYTQTTDLEHEINGLVTYDRYVEKMNIPRIREINRAVIEGDCK